MKKRRKDKYNPYTLIEIKERNIYIVSFKNIYGTYSNIEVSKEIYDVFDKSELKELSQMNEFDRHIEHLEVSENILEKRINEKQMLLEDYIIQQSTFEELSNAINLLSEAQKRRIKMYYFDDLKLEEIAKIEGTSFQMISKSINQGIINLRKLLKK